MNIDPDSIQKPTDPARWTDRGSDVRTYFFEDTEGTEIGLIIEHPSGPNYKMEGGRCIGTVYFVPSGKWAVWQVINWMPLTLSPSILCSCGFHGWIQNGKWVSA